MPLQIVSKTVSDACLVEIYAYVQLEMAAKEIGRYRDVFDFALDDLREQAIDCLKSLERPAASDEPTPRDTVEFSERLVSASIGQSCQDDAPRVGRHDV